MNQEDVRKLLKKACDAAGGQTAWGLPIGISSGYIGDVLSGRMAPGPKICKALGIERVTTYRKTRREPDTFGSGRE